VLCFAVAVFNDVVDVVKGDDDTMQLKKSSTLSTVKSDTPSTITAVTTTATARGLCVYINK